ncbi:hypothetical protein HPB50_001691 [Hyalomma asiaticum]|uniref:Uncharacterized protein n=1 Tax=Hyalomma asiaticum TaxID=266040 RepID=A0ACB7T7Q7_HYAAI|nr:hypothetical protein HPB50_001691 [Hyalomma asiaticum]
MVAEERYNSLYYGLTSSQKRSSAVMSAAEQAELLGLSRCCASQRVSLTTWRLLIKHSTLARQINFVAVAIELQGKLLTAASFRNPMEERSAVAVAVTIPTRSHIFTNARAAA